MATCPSITTAISSMPAKKGLSLAWPPWTARCWAWLGDWVNYAKFADRDTLGEVQRKSVASDLFLKLAWGGTFNQS